MSCRSWHKAVFPKKIPGALGRDPSSKSHSRMFLSLLLIIGLYVCKQESEVYKFKDHGKFL